MSETDPFVILGELLKAEATVQPEKNEYGKTVLVLEEPQHAGEPVTISNLPDRLVVIRSDVFDSPRSVFKGTRGECKRADYVIIAERDNNRGKFIICLEMKRGSTDPAKVIEQQLCGAKCFIEYCREIARTFWHADDFLDGFAYRFVSIRRTSLPKQKTRIDRSRVVHDQPERMLKITSPHHLEFNRLAGQQ